MKILDPPLGKVFIHVCFFLYFCSGHYVYIEASGRQEGHRARLISPMLTGHSGQASCLIFYYHMYGYMMGELNVYIKNSTSDNLGTAQWALSGNRGNKWRAAELEIKTPYDYQVCPGNWCPPFYDEHLVFMEISHDFCVVLSILYMALLVCEWVCIYKCL